MEKLTAAHRTLPFGTWVRVINLTNDKTVDVRIIDRGPFVEDRIIDLSHAAAVAIELIGPGVAQVRLDILSVPTIASAKIGTRCKPAPSSITTAPSACARRSNANSVRRTWCCAPIAQRSGAWWSGQRSFRGSRQCLWLERVRQRIRYRLCGTSRSRRANSRTQASSART